MIPSAAAPLHYLFRLPIPSLKNNRQLIVSEATGKTKSIPRAAVRKAIADMRSAINRQHLASPFSALPFPIFPTPQEVYVAVYLGVYYLSALPESDVDNAYTTIQEAMQGLVYAEDNQVADFYPHRVRFRSRTSLYTEVWVWPIGADRTPMWKELPLVLEGK